MNISIKSNIQRLSAELKLTGEELVKAAVRSVNRTATTVRAEAARELGKSYAGLQINAIRRRIKLQRADRNKPVATLTFGTQRLRLINWAVRQTNSGVRGRMPATLFRIDTITGRSSKVTGADLRHAFIRRSRSRFNPRGLENVWLRQGKASYPIDVIVTPSLSETLVAQRIDEALVRLGADRFLVVFRQEARFSLLRRAA